MRVALCVVPRAAETSPQHIQKNKGSLNHATYPSGVHALVGAVRRLTMIIMRRNIMRAKL